MNIQKRIDALQPHVVGIRLANGFMVVDAVFNGGWKVPSSDVIESVKSNEDERYYMFYSEKEGIEVDDILNFVGQVIDMNIEREKKYELLKVKTEELKDLFKKNSLSKLENMKFVLGGESLIPESMPEDFDEISMDDIDETPKEEPKQTKVEKPVTQKKEPQQKTIKNQNVELPPKDEKIVVEEFEEPTVVCNCGPDDMCPVCVDEKMAAE